jgi:hypothetical protein
LRVFEVAAMARSYYDPMILGCFLRWMRPHEIFWGWTGAEARTTALHVLERGDRAHQRILVPEMLLAAAQGKLTREAAEEAVGVAGELFGNDCPDHVRAALQAGLALIPDVKKLPATAGAFEQETVSADGNGAVDDGPLDAKAIAADEDLLVAEPGPEDVGGDG